MQIFMGKNGGVSKSPGKLVAQPALGPRKSTRPQTVAGEPWWTPLENAGFSKRDRDRSSHLWGRSLERYR